MKRLAQLLTALLAVLLMGSVTETPDTCCPRPAPPRSCCAPNSCCCHVSSSNVPQAARQVPANLPASNRAPLLALVPAFAVALPAGSVQAPAIPLAQMRLTAAEQPLYALTNSFLI